MLTKTRYYLYLAIILVLVMLSIFFFYQNYSLNRLYSFHKADLNMSGLCSPNMPSFVIYYADNCRTCASTVNSFQNVTSLFGLWSNNTFYSGYFCAWKFNISAYNNNITNNIPDSAVLLFNQIAVNKVPLIVFNGKYYKVGGFTDNETAYNEILNYICLSVNESLPQCS
ncbi:hypothetical protein M1384_03205 [Candidatus Parvarchaeota archaeon]|jgi:hypothetical protein|nr:hypothetical protein [Candidatus Parvarchaeota archaeon]MCL5976286.1 hypothetical protein [Candidatus Parvarchaeota archaeon]